MLLFSCMMLSSFSFVEACFLNTCLVRWFGAFPHFVLSLYLCKIQFWLSKPWKAIYSDILCIHISVTRENLNCQQWLIRLFALLLQNNHIFRFDLTHAVTMYIIQAKAQWPRNDIRGLVVGVLVWSRINALTNAIAAVVYGKVRQQPSDGHGFSPCHPSGFRQS